MRRSLSGNGPIRRPDATGEQNHSPTLNRRRGKPTPRLALNDRLLGGSVDLEVSLDSVRRNAVMTTKTSVIQRSATFDSTWSESIETKMDSEPLWDDTEPSVDSEQTSQTPGGFGYYSHGGIVDDVDPIPWYKCPGFLHTKHSVADRVILNVGGTIFEVSKFVLDRYPETLLGSEERDYFYDESVNEYRFDRDPEVFRYILNFYRTGKLHYPEAETLGTYEEELMFFRLGHDALPDIISPCCRESYLDKKEARDQLKQEKAKEALKLIKRNPEDIRGLIWAGIENPTGNCMSAAFFYVIMFFITISIATNTVETLYCGATDKDVPVYCGERYPHLFYVIETSCAMLFTSEYCVRLFAAPDRWLFVKSPMAIIDLLSILPFYLALILPKNSNLSGVFVTLRVFRVFRVFKLSRSSTNLKLLGLTLKSCLRDLSFLLFALAMTVILFSTVIYYAEKGVPNGRFTSIPQTSWYVVVTMTTLGYGEIVANTVFGKIVTAVCCVSSVILLTLPVTVIVSNFNNLYRPDKLKDDSPPRKNPPPLAPKELEIFHAQHRHLLTCIEKSTGHNFTTLRFPYIETEHWEGCGHLHGHGHSHGLRHLTHRDSHSSSHL
ncbi:KCND2 [Branchiostoma lanceolatum]|uniref:KCND2 protein n=1 Tax=Branchiostoma lanceolatum TaxID=7740 RepID=A0A8J9V9R9_BRALA|nr:KCND2 [Branchiostoma lanceolatum]